MKKNSFEKFLYRKSNFNLYTLVLKIVLNDDFDEES